MEKIFTVRIDDVPGTLRTMLNRLQFGGVTTYAAMTVQCGNEIWRSIITNDDNRTQEILELHYRDKYFIGDALQSEALLAAGAFYRWLPLLPTDQVISPLLCVPTNLDQAFIGVAVSSNKIDDTIKLFRQAFVNSFDNDYVPLIIVNLPVSVKLRPLFECITSSTIFRKIELGRCNEHRQIYLIPFKDDERSINQLINEIQACGIAELSIEGKYLIKAISAAQISGDGGISAIANLLGDESINIEVVTLVPEEPAENLVYYGVVPR